MNRLNFVTDTLIDLMEMSVLGLGSKRGDDSKIGHKGSGLKFAIALIHRLGSSLYVTINGRRWHSQLRTITVRGAEHQIIVLVADDDGEVRDLNIVLEAGADTWTSSWYVLRELLQNCLDEGGYFTESLLIDPANHEGTIMSLEMTEDLSDAWDNCDHWYNRRHPGIIYDRGNLAGGLFYHGFRISTEEGWTYCYDVTDLIGRDNLSEDRQAKGINLRSLFQNIVKQASAEWTPSIYTAMARWSRKDDNDIGFLLEAVYHHIDSTVKIAGNWHLSAFEDAFIAIHGSKVAYTSSECISERDAYYASAAGVAIVRVPYRVGYVLQYSERIKSIARYIPDLAARLKPVRASDLDQSVKERLKAAERMTRSMRPAGCKVDIVDVEFKDDASEGAVCAKADIEANRVMLMRRWVEGASTGELVEGLIEEYAHINSRCGDGSIEFEKHLIRIIAAKVMPKPKALGVEAFTI